MISNLFRFCVNNFDIVIDLYHSIQSAENQIETEISLQFLGLNWPLHYFCFKILLLMVRFWEKINGKKEQIKQINLLKLYYELFK